MTHIKTMAEATSTLPSTTLYFGADHGGFGYKESLKSIFQNQGFQVVDCGAFQVDPVDDFTDFAFAVAEKVGGDAQSDKSSFGVLLCRSGAGMVIAANKVPGIRAVVAHSVAEAIHAREHNDANVIAFSGDWQSETECAEILKVFLETAFPKGENHVRRIAKIAQYERE